MRVINGGRQTGRTTTLIELCAEAEAKGEVSYIVCHSRDAAYEIAKRAEEFNLRIGFPLSYDEFLKRQYAGRNIKHFFIDNADMLLQYLSPTVRIEAIVLEKEAEDGFNSR